MYGLWIPFCVSSLHLLLINSVASVNGYGHKVHLEKNLNEKFKQHQNNEAIFRLLFAVHYFVSPFRTL